MKGDVGVESQSMLKRNVYEYCPIALIRWESISLFLILEISKPAIVIGISYFLGALVGVAEWHHWLFDDRKIYRQKQHRIS